MVQLEELPAIAPSPLGVSPSAMDGTVNPIQLESLADAQESTPKEADGMDLPQKKKKKKKSRSRKGKAVSKRGPTALPGNRGTGFEEYFADPPMTPAEALEEKEEIYNPNYSFGERIQQCIMRFRSRRRLVAELARYFDEYLFLGGIDSKPNAFQGIDPRELKNMTPAERREASSHDVVCGNDENDSRFFDGNMEHWEVDFAGVAAGFFSSMQSHLGLELDQMGDAIRVVDNFLRYVLQHEVCPEYKSNIQEALKLCDTAQEEWRMIGSFLRAVPGQFNLAAAEYLSAFEENDWALLDFTRPDKFDPRVYFLTALMVAGEEDLFRQFSTQKHFVSRQFDCTLVVVDISRPAADITKIFRSLSIGEKTQDIQPIGKVILQPATIEDGFDVPFAPEAFTGTDMTLLLNDTLLVNLKKGMKLTVSVCELDNGFRFMKRLHEIVPSFYTFLPQELMRYFREPQVNERSAPSATLPDDIEVEEE